MNRSISKIRHIQESNQRLEKRLLNEQTNNLVGKTVTLYSDKSLTKALGVVKVTGMNKENNSAGISFEGNLNLGDFVTTNAFTIVCGSNMVNIKKVFVMPGNVSEENMQAYVSPKLVEFLKPLICTQETKQPAQVKSDF